MNTMRYTTGLLAAAILFVFLFGIFKTIKEGITVAPFMKEQLKPDEDRLLLHTKNITRLTGDVDEIGEQVESMVDPYLENHQYTHVGQDGIKPLVKSLISGGDSKHIVVLSEAEEHLVWTLPALYYAYYHGSQIVFPDELERVEGTGKKVFVPVPPEVISDDQLNGVEFTRIHGGNPAAHAVEIAEYRDESSEFGWGREYNRRTGYFHFVVTTPKDVKKALAALPLAKTNSATLLYADDNGGIPAETDMYMWSQRSDWMVTPSESPFRHFFIVSDNISYASHARIDFSVEKSEYASYGAVALGPMDAIAIVFLMAGICGAILVFVHSVYFIPEVNLSIKIAWFLGTILLPVLGPVLYFSAYRRPVYENGKMIRFLRPNNIQSASATIMGFGYGAPLMIAVAYIFAFFGFPIFFPEWFGGYTFWLGAGMPFMMIMMYVLAVLIAWPLVQFPMKQMMMDMSKNKLLWISLKVTAVSMFFVSLGMMSFNWWMMMWHINMMPHEDDILWFFSIAMASFVGFVVAWPFNWMMIRKKLKPGNL